MPVGRRPVARPFELTEAQFQRQVEKLCKDYGALWYHTHDSKRSNPGFPDLVIVTKANRMLYRELKTRTGRVSPEQKVWIARLELAGQDAGIWRPADMARIVAELRVI